MINELRFGKAHIEGFGSIANQEFDWGVTGLNVIKAPNGFGKTKFINALYWCCYGKTLSGSVDMWEHVRPKDYRGTKVEQEFINQGVKYKVVRCRGYSGKVEGAKGGNRLLFYRGGDFKNVKKGQVQKEIENALGYSPELFKNTIIFGQKLKRIISETGPNKKRVLEEAFEMLFITKGKKLAEAEVSKLRMDKVKLGSSMNVLEAKLGAKQNSLEHMETLIRDFEANKESEIQAKNIEIKRVEDKLGSVNKEISIYEGQVEDTKSLQNQLYGLNKKLSKLPTNLEKEKGKLESDIRYADIDKSKLSKDIARLKTQLEHIPTHCSRCGKEYTKSELKEEKGRIQKEVADLEKDIKLQIDNITLLNQKLLGITNKLSSYKSLTSSIELLKEKLNKLESNKKYRDKLNSQVKEYTDELVELRASMKLIEAKVPKNNTEELIRDIRDLKKDLRPLRIQYRKITKSVEAYEWVVKDPLSNSGLKAFIFNEMLGSINDRLMYYSKFIRFQVHFSMDLKSHNRDLQVYVFQGDYPVPYEDLSGGQQQSVDIASAFAIHDVVSGTKRCALLVMDELFESLDKNNIEILTELIQDKAKDKCLYLVTHRNEFAPTNSRTIQLRISSGITHVM